MNIHKSASEKRPLPFSSEDTKYILRTGKIDFEKTYVRPKNSSNFYLGDIPGNSALSWPPALPEFDPRGHSSAPAYQYWHKAQISKIGMAGNYFSFKAHGLLPGHSALEDHIRSCLEMNPLVIEIRAQYPEWDDQIYHQRAALGLRMPKKSVMTVDFILTLKYPNESKPRYHAISCKPNHLVNEIKNIKRHKREADLLKKWNCTHEIMTEHTFSLMQSVNCRRLYGYMCYVDDITKYKSAAARMAFGLLSKKRCKTADEDIGIVSQKNNWHLNEGYRYFALAVFLGYIFLDHRYELLPDYPLYLIKTFSLKKQKKNI